MELEGEEALFEIGQGREIIRGKDLSLNDREIDLNRELSAINRLIVAEEDGPGERRYSFPVGILLGR